jgi:hypothetical protein
MLYLKWGIMGWCAGQQQAASMRHSACIADHKVGFQSTALKKGCPAALGLVRYACCSTLPSWLQAAVQPSKQTLDCMVASSQPR